MGLKNQVLSQKSGTVERMSEEKTVKKVFKNTLKEKGL
jgi:hypothetical protein